MEVKQGDFAMSKETVVKDIEQVIKAAKKECKQNPTGDKIRQFTGLINCYTRLTQSEILDGTDDGKGDRAYYAGLMAAE